jgi:hypothetical protein
MDYEEKEQHERTSERLAACRELAAIQERMKSCSDDELPRVIEELRAALAKVRELEKAETRIGKQAEAFAHSMGEAMLSAFEGLSVLDVTEALEEAAESAREIIKERGGLTREHLRQIEAAHDKFIEELNILRMFEKS